MISIIVAFDNRRAIGKDNKMPWHISADLKHFKAITMGHPIVMGRKTYESLPVKPLPGRKNIVLSRKQTNGDNNEIQWLHSLDEFLQLAQNKEDEFFVIGGGEIYKALLPYADKLYITRIFASYDADSFFPEYDEKAWQLIAEERFEEEPVPFAFQEFIKK
jgi:dihydrofolate reductase